MKTFLCAVCILLSMVALMLLYTGHTVSQIDRLTAEIDSLPCGGEEGCLAAVIASETRWQRMRQLVSLSVNNRTVEQIDHLMSSLRVTAAEGEATDFEINRGQLREALRSLRRLTLCDIWGIV